MANRPEFRSRRGARLALGLAVALGALVWWRSRPPAPPTSSDVSQAEVQRLVRAVSAVEAREAEVAQTVWAPEMQAQQYGRVFERLWDGLNAATNKLEALAALDGGAVVVPQFGPPQALDLGIAVRDAVAPGVTWAPATWRSEVQAWRAAGWDLVQSEFRHYRFEPAGVGRAAQSTVHFRGHLTRAAGAERAVLEGDLQVEWGSGLTPEGGPAWTRLDASALQLRQRAGDPIFQPVWVQEVEPVAGTHFIDPLILQDLESDGFPEIILAARNLVLRRRSGDRFESEPLCAHDPGLIFTAVMADFDGDGARDFLFARFEGLWLGRGDVRGRFPQPPELVWRAEPRLKYGQVLTAGDVDADGDLDVWLGQYKNPYDRGQMPTPFYDARDGHPSWLLLNDGHGRFTDATVTAGLAAKRFRRTYAASLVDLDTDGDLDLLVVSDFAGVDLYANDGHGQFQDVTARWVDENRLFGMAHTFGDYDADGRLDFLATGMTCPTPQRLAHLGLVRPGFEAYAAAIPKMVAGNRLYLGHADGRWRQTEFSQGVARSGWSWGCDTLDFDNDGWPDVYVANGHETHASVQDYEAEFWLHDLYVADSKDDLVRHAYFSGKIARTRGQGQSYGGWEKNRLYWNRGGTRFLEVGHLLGLALEEDCRNVAAGDLDGDGRVDLVVTTFETWPRVRQTVRVFSNRHPTPGTWIGLRAPPGGFGPAFAGAQAILSRSGQAVAQALVTGDSHRVQHAGDLHFGLGPSLQGVGLRIRRVGGAEAVWSALTPNRYHPLVPPPSP